MTTRPVLQPTDDHPITVTPTPGRVTVHVHGQLVADTAAALTLRESSYPPVQYIPIADVDPGVLRRRTDTTYCPYKGDASYYDVTTAGGTTAAGVIWTYAHPYPAVALIADHVAFYPDRADIVVEAWD